MSPISVRDVDECEETGELQKFSLLLLGVPVVGGACC